MQQRSPRPGPRGGHSDTPAIIEKKDLAHCLELWINNLDLGIPMGNEWQHAWPWSEYKPQKQCVRFSRGRGWGEQSEKESESNCPLDKRFINAKSVVGFWSKFSATHDKTKWGVFFEGCSGGIREGGDQLAIYDLREMMVVKLSPALEDRKTGSILNLLCLAQLTWNACWFLCHCDRMVWKQA